MPKNEKNDVTLRVIATFSEQVNERRNVTVAIRVVEWGSNGKVYPPMLEKREIYVSNVDNVLKSGKAKGFTVADLALISEKWDEIMDAMGVHPKDQFKKEDAHVADLAAHSVATSPAVPEDF